MSAGPHGPYREVFNAAPDGILVVDGEGTIRSGNPALTRLFGYTLEELVGQPIELLVPAAARAAHVDDRSRFMVAPRARPMGTGRELVGLRKDGSEIPVDIMLSPMSDGVVAFVRDATERRAAMNALRRNERHFHDLAVETRDLYDNAPCGYHSLDGDGIFVHVNETELRWLGRAREELIGRTRFVDLLTPDSRAFFTAAFARFRDSGATNDLELEMVRKDGTTFDAQLSATALRDADGHFVMSRSTLFDITERKKMERELVRARTVAEAASRELEAFSYSVAHDLRAPLRSIDGFSQAILEDYADRLDDDGRDHLRRVRGAAQRMAQLIDDLLALARVTRSEIHRERVSLTRIATEAIARLRLTAPERHVEVAIADGLFVDADPRLLAVAVENLLGNAWKFTRKRDGARIEVGSIVADGATAWFVRDNGAGFDMAYAGQLFSPFKRLHKPSEFEGTGIGLATVQRVILRHGGRVWAEGAVEKGATFYFVL